MDTSLPVSEDITMTLAAENIALRKIDEITICESQLIPVTTVVAIQTPSDVFCVPELYIVVGLL
jgi:hypothetical protein